MRNILSTLAVARDTARINRAIENSKFLGDNENFARRKVFDYYVHRATSIYQVQAAIAALALFGTLIHSLNVILVVIIAFELSELLTYYWVGKAIIAYEQHQFDTIYWKRIRRALEIGGLIAFNVCFGVTLMFTTTENIVLVAAAWLTTVFFVMFVTSRQLAWLSTIIGIHSITALTLIFYKLNNLPIAPSPSLYLDIGYTIILYIVICLASAYLMISYTDRSLANERAASIKDREAQQQRALLSEEKSLLDTIQNSLSEAIILADAQGNIIRANRAFEEIFGPQTAVNMLEIFNREVLTPDDVRRSIRTDAGRTVLVQGKVLDLAEPGPNLLYIFIDITEKVAADEQNQQLQKINALGTLANGIAHDFNNYLAVIQTNTEMLIDSLQKRGGNANFDPTQDNALLDDILTACHSSAGQTRRLLRFTRKMPTDPEIIRVRDICKRAHDIARSSLGPLYKFVVDYDVEDTIYVDPNYFETSLLNLFINARDAMPSGGTIEFTAKTADDKVTIALKDNGIGIPPTNLARVTEPFFTTKRNMGGSGIGLTNVVQFAEQSNGSFHITSLEGLGTTATLALPLRKQGNISNPADQAIRPVPLQIGARIGIVDDNVPYAQSLRLHLKAMGFDAIEMNNVEAFREECGAKKFDLIVCDIILQNENGLQVYDHYREQGYDEPILFISGNLPAYFHNKIASTFNTSFLEKPFPTAKLVDRINSMLVSHNASISRMQKLA